MSLVTTCPACKTRFLVRPEQLSVRQGQVQCGHCQHIFNALEGLQEIPLSHEEPANPSAAEAPLPLDDSISAEVRPETIVQAPDQTPDQPLSPALEQAPEPETSSMDSAQDEATEPTRQPEVTPEIPFSSTDHQTIDALSPELSEQSEQQEVVSTESAADLQAEAFLNAKTKRKTPLWLKFLQAIALLLLFVLALAQAAYFERSLLAAYVPESRHWLNLACAKLQCTVGLPKHPESLTIEDQDMLESAEQAGLIRLSSTLINNGAIALEYPMITLELLDANERPLVRRDFSPAQYLDKEIAIPAGIPAGGEVPVHLLFKTEAPQVAGFKIRVHY